MRFLVYNINDYYAFSICICILPPRGIITFILDMDGIILTNKIEAIFYEMNKYKEPESNNAETN